MAHILLIEPNALLARQYTEALESAGHSMSIHANAQEAILAADEQTPDIVILELTLAGHSGIEFLYEFRSYAEWQNVPVIINSRLRQHELKLSSQAVKELNIAAILYKADAKLTRLIRVINKTLQLVHE
jgi:two-component system, OmpR family, phosphate regulon response regulator PhoB